MSSKVAKTSPSSQQQSRWSIFFRNPLLLKILVWLGSLSLMSSAGGAWANLKPPTPQARSIVQLSPFLSTDLPIDIYSPPIDRRQSPIQTTPSAPAAPSPVSPAVTRGKIVPPQHINLLTADNYLVGISGSDLQPKIAPESIDIHVPPPRQTTIPDRSKDILTTTKSKIEPSYIKPQQLIDRSIPETTIQSKFNPQQSPSNLLSITDSVPTSPPKPVARPRSNLPTSLSSKARSSAGLKSNILAPMKPRVTPGKSQLKSPASLAVDSVNSIDRPAETSLKLSTPQIAAPPVNQLLKIDRVSSSVPTVPKISSIPPRLKFSQSKPIAFINPDPSQPTPENPVETTTSWSVERLAKISELKITDPSFQPDPQAPPEAPKQIVPLSTNTKMIVGVKVLQANDFADTLDPQFDNNENSMISQFGSRAGIYFLVAGSGVGVRHQFSSTLEGSVGILVRSAADTIQNKSGTSGNNSNLNNKSADSSSNNTNSALLGGSLTSSYGTIAQLTYTPTQSVKVGLTYVYGYNVNPGIGSENANKTDGGTNAIGLQTYLRLQPNLAVSGWIGVNQNNSFELNKNILTWALTAAIPDLGGKGNLAGIVIGQEPRVTGANNLEVLDTGSALHLEGFYQIKISEDFSITPAIVYLTGPNVDNVASGASSILGAIGFSYNF